MLWVGNTRLIAFVTHQDALARGSLWCIGRANTLWQMLFGNEWVSVWEYCVVQRRRDKLRIYTIKATPGYKNKFILIDSQWLVKTNGATFIFIEKLGNKFLPGQFWPCLSFSVLRHGPKSWFLILWTKAQASLLLWYEFVRWWGREIRFEWVLSAFITVEDHTLQLENK